MLVCLQLCLSCCNQKSCTQDITILIDQTEEYFNDVSFEDYKSISIIAGNHNSFSEWLDSFSFKPEIADLYLQIVEETFKKEDNIREKEILKLKKEIDEVTAALLKTEKKYIKDEIEKDSYLLLKESFKKEENELREYLFELQSTDSGFMEYMRYGCSVLSNLRKCYDSSDLDTKQKLISSIFPEKLIFENGTYRTTKANELLRLLCLNDVAFGEIKKGQSTKKRKLSHQVEIVGLEPTTPCMPCKYSSQLSYTPVLGKDKVLRSTCD